MFEQRLTKHIKIINTKIWSSKDLQINYAHFIVTQRVFKIVISCQLNATLISSNKHHKTSQSYRSCRRVAHENQFHFNLFFGGLSFGHTFTKHDTDGLPQKGCFGCSFMTIVMRVIRRKQNSNEPFTQTNKQTDRVKEKDSQSKRERERVSLSFRIYFFRI